jgi:hypothetical protein
VVILAWVLKVLASYCCYRCCKNKYPRQFAKFEAFFLKKLGYQYTRLDADSELCMEPHIPVGQCMDACMPALQSSSCAEVVVDKSNQPAKDMATGVQLAKFDHTMR